MKTSIPQLTKLSARQALETHYTKVWELHLRNLFVDDLNRVKTMTFETIGI